MDINRKRKKGVIIGGVAMLAMTIFMAVHADLCTGQSVPPPVRQGVGAPDTVWFFLSETECRECHQHDATYLPDRHHLLVGTLIGDSYVPNPDSDGVEGPDLFFDCLNCHGMAWTGSAWVLDQSFRDCLTCHFGETPHHLTDEAVAGECQGCHGTIVSAGADDPSCTVYTGAATEFTPYPEECRVCHDAGTTDEGLQVYAPMENHHLTGLYGLHLQGVQVCTWCHKTDPDDQFIILTDDNRFRSCENCHCKEANHGIQGESTLAYYGHQTSEACLACHPRAFAPTTQVMSTNPWIDAMSPTSVWAEETTTVTVTGTAFADAVPEPLDSDVSLTDASGNETVLEPLAVTESSIEVDIPSTLAAGNYKLTAVKGAKFSNPLILSVTPPPHIDIVTCVDAAVNVTGSGLGGYMEAEDAGTSITGKVVKVNPKNGKTTTTTEQGVVSSWNDTDIAAQFTDCPEPGTVEVNTIFTTLRTPGGTVACGDYTLKSACNDDPNCEWQGNPSNGQCVESGGGGCTPTSPDETGLCGDGIDNDCDGSTDCADSPDCDGDPICQSSDCSQYPDKGSCQADASCRWNKKQNECVNN